MTDSIEYEGRIYDRVSFAPGELVQEGDIYCVGGVPSVTRDAGRLPHETYYRARKVEPEMVMVTIEVPLSVARRYAEADSAIGVQLRKQFSDALAARKTKYEQWQFYRHFPWSADEHCVLHNGVHGLVGDTGDAKLMAAAPQLLEALIAEHKFGGRGNKKPVAALVKRTTEAIRAATPAEVADEILEETK